jgi:glucan endo-1,3-beta-D-glucosidase
MRLTLASAAMVAGVSAQNYLGFNSGSTKVDRSAKFKADWISEFTTAQKLPGAPGVFNAVRLYTNIQAYSESDPIEAFEAALETNTLMLLGVWTSGTDSIEKEVVALQKAVKKYGKPFVDLVIGISIGSEDLYRNSVTGVANKAGVGNQPDAIVRFINDFKTAFSGTALASKPIGHVDTWDVWPNATNKAVIDAVDWIGVDEYPYYENGKGNDITNAAKLFDTAYDAAVNAAGGKPVWLTETGWPVTGPAWDLAVPSVQNAKTYWDQIGCRRLFNKTPTFWYTLRDSNPDNEAKFAVAVNLEAGQPAFNLTCPTSFATDTSGGGSNSGNGNGGNGNGGGSAPAQGSTGGNQPGKNAGTRALADRAAVVLGALAIIALSL